MSKSTAAPKPVRCSGCYSKNPPPWSRASKWWCQRCGRSHTGYQHEEFEESRVYGFNDDEDAPSEPCAAPPDLTSNDAPVILALVVLGLLALLFSLLHLTGVR